MFMHIMFSEPFIKASLIDDSEKNLYKRVDIIPETCEIVLGKTSCRWWNRILGAEKVIGFETFVFRVVGAYSGKDGAIGDIVAKGLAEDAVRSIIIQGRSNDMIDRLFIVGYLAVPTAFSCSELNSGISAPIQGSKTDPGGGAVREIRYEPVDREINLNVNCGGKTHTFVLPGTNDPILRIQTGLTGVEVLQ